MDQQQALQQKRSEIQYHQSVYSLQENMMRTLANQKHAHQAESSHQKLVNQDQGRPPQYQNQQPQFQGHSFHHQGQQPHYPGQHPHFQAENIPYQGQQHQHPGVSSHPAPAITSAHPMAASQHTHMHAQPQQPQQPQPAHSTTYPSLHPNQPGPSAPLPPTSSVTMSPCHGNQPCTQCERYPYSKVFERVNADLHTISRTVQKMRMFALMLPRLQQHWSWKQSWDLQKTLQKMCALEVELLEVTAPVAALFQPVGDLSHLEGRNGVLATGHVFKRMVEEGPFPGQQEVNMLLSNMINGGQENQQPQQPNDYQAGNWPLQGGVPMTGSFQGSGSEIGNEDANMTDSTLSLPNDFHSQQQPVQTQYQCNQLNQNPPFTVPAGYLQVQELNQNGQPESSGLHPSGGSAQPHIPMASTAATHPQLTPQQPAHGNQYHPENTSTPQFRFEDFIKLPECEEEPSGQAPAFGQLNTGSASSSNATNPQPVSAVEMNSVMNRSSSTQSFHGSDSTCILPERPAVMAASSAPGNENSFVPGRPESSSNKSNIVMPSTPGGHINASSSTLGQNHDSRRTPVPGFQPNRVGKQKPVPKPRGVKKPKTGPEPVQPKYEYKWPRDPSSPGYN